MFLKTYVFNFICSLFVHTMLKLTKPICNQSGAHSSLTLLEKGEGQDLVSLTHFLKPDKLKSTSFIMGSHNLTLGYIGTTNSHKNTFRCFSDAAEQ